jgi:hypothetical protein
MFGLRLDESDGSFFLQDKVRRRVRDNAFEGGTFSLLEEGHV